MTIAENLRYAILLNNKACRLIKQGKYEPAIADLFEALRATKKSAVEWNNTTVSGSSDDDCAMDESDCDSSAESSGPEADKMSYNHNDVYDIREYASESSGPFIYRHPSLLKQRMAEESYLPLISFTIIFNLALSHHLGGVEASLPTAKRLYELAFQMQNQIPERNLVQMAGVLNNLSLLHFQLGSEYEGSQCQKLLLSVVLLIVDFHDTEAASQVDGFFSNVMHLVMKETHFAAAA